MDGQGGCGNRGWGNMSAYLLVGELGNQGNKEKRAKKSRERLQMFGEN